MYFLASRGYRCIAHDRRGHGRSSQPWHGNDLDTYADDLAELTQQLDLTKAIHVGHSTGGGEVARYIGRHGTKRVAKAVLISAIPPLMLKTAANPGGLPMEAFDQIRAGVVADRSQFWKDLSMPFYGYNRPGAKVSEGVRNSFWLQGMMAGFPASYFCIKAFSETDTTEDLKKFRSFRSARLPCCPPRSSRERTSRSTRARRTACARPSRTRSTPSCWTSSRAEADRGRKASVVSRKCHHHLWRAPSWHLRD